MEFPSEFRKSLVLHLGHLFLAVCVLGMDLCERLKGAGGQLYTVDSGRDSFCETSSLCLFLLSFNMQNPDSL